MPWVAPDVFAAVYALFGLRQWFCSTCDKFVEKFKGSSCVLWQINPRYHSVVLG